MQVAHVDPAAVDEGAVGFRLAPRINAAGRLGHPREALELLLTDDADEARRLAQRLEEVNRERQAVEERILRSAVAQIEEWPENKRRRHGYALADADWHEGVIGIVASRLVERYHRPVVLIAGGEEHWKGSGRSVGAFDLHEALSACSDHLLRWGGHRAAAGLSIGPVGGRRVRARLRGARGRDALATRSSRRSTLVDAIVPRGLPLTLELAQELAQLAPFGLGNPGVTLLAPSCELRDLGTVGDGKHLKFRVRGENGGDAGSAIAFGLGSHLDRLRRVGRFDVLFRLEENRWNGTVAPQLVVRRVFDAEDRYEELAAWLRAQWKLDDARPGRPGNLRRAAARDGVKRSLLESERFRALLAEPVALPAAPSARAA